MAERATTPRNRSTVRDVAATAGVSAATVSRVLNNQPSVSEDSRKVVEAAVEHVEARRTRRCLPGESGPGRVELNFRRAVRQVAQIVPGRPDVRFPDEACGTCLARRQQRSEIERLTFDNLKLRQAFRLSVDVDKILEAAFFGSAKRAKTVLPPGGGEPRLPLKNKSKGSRRGA